MYTKKLVKGQIEFLDSFLPFSRPTIEENEISEVVECLKSGWITTGPRVAQFESMLEDYLGAPHVLTVSSATAGLFMVLKSLNLQPGEEVITTPLTFAATVNVIELAGGTPVLVDVDRATYNLDVNQLVDAITPRTRVIMPVHFAGMPVDLDPLYEIARDKGIRVIEDAAHAIGSSYKGRKIGSFGDIQVFSFHPNKNMTTGEGGAIALRDAPLMEDLKLLRFHGIDREAWARFGKKGTQNYEIVKPGFKFNLMDLQASLGIHQLGRLDGFNRRRKDLADHYRAGLVDLKELILPQEPKCDCGHAWHLFAPLVNEPFATSLDRDAVMEKLKSRNVGTGLHYQAIHLFSYYRNTYGWVKGDFPNAEYIADRIFSLPLYPNLTDEVQESVINIIREVFKSV